MSHRTRCGRDRRLTGADAGSTLVEVLVAMLVTSAGVLSVAQLFWIATADVVTAGQDSLATVLAAQKLEELRAPVSADALDPSPPGALDAAVEGFVDHVGAGGRVVGASPAAPVSALFTRRWSVAPVPGTGGALVLVRVIAMPSRRGTDSRTVRAGRLPGAARVDSIVAGRVP